jgi:general secretion pathway protein E/type IV pilus assembly protein PilB
VTSADEFVLQLLIDKNIVEASVVEDAKAKAAEEDSTVDVESVAIDLLVAAHSVSQQQIADMLAEEFNMDTVDLDDVRVDSQALSIVPLELANRYKVFPLHADDSEVELAICDPFDMDMIDSISHVIKRSITSSLGSHRKSDSPLL